jgi:hypothetical protein
MPRRAICGSRSSGKLVKRRLRVLQVTRVNTRVATSDLGRTAPHAGAAPKRTFGHFAFLPKCDYSNKTGHRLGAAAPQVPLADVLFQEA